LTLCGTLFLNSAGPLVNGRFTALVTNGQFTYEPDAGFVGTESFTYLMRDDDDNFATPTPATIEVLPDPNRAPIGIPDYYATLEGVPLSVPAPGLIGNDVDPDGDMILLNSAGPLNNGRFTTLVTNGQFTYEPDPGFVGREEFTYLMRDEHGLSATPVTVVIDVLREDLTPPEIVVPGEPIVLWPPNHRYHTIQVADLVSAINDDDPDLSPDDVVIVSVTSDEVDNNGADGNTINDMVIGAACRSVDLRMERVEGGNGRVYVIQFAAEDASGNVGEAFVEVHVPADRMNPAVADAPVNLVNGTCPTS
jgi:hypothetical protein